MMRKLADFIAQHDDFAVIGHVSPDGDALGSGLALVYILRKLGKRAALVSADPAPDMYDMLPGLGDIAKPDALPFAPRCLLLEDVAALDRAGDRGALIGLHLPSAIIDHHGTNPKPFPISVVDGNASATGELVVDLMDLLGVSLDRDIALCLYAAISTDTGNFSYPNTTPKAFRAAARFLEAGIDLAAVNFLLFRVRSVPRAKLFGAALNRMEFFLNGRVAMARITGEMFEACSATFPQTEGIVQALAEIRGVDAAIVVEYRAPGECKLSLRSNCALDVSKIARDMGGGGHHNAAGMTYWGSVDDAAVCVSKIVSDALAAL